MSDLFLNVIQTPSGQILSWIWHDFLWAWLCIMVLFFYLGGWRPLSKKKRDITESRKALEDLRGWNKKHLEFRAGRHSREANAPSDSTLNPRTQKWLRLLWSGYCQKKPPIIDEVVQREEEYLCSDDERIRSASNILIILGLLGTFVGLYKVILPIESIIQNSTDIANLLENIDQSFSGMELAFVTSIAGLLGMIALNIGFSRFSKKRFELIDEIETYCSEEIAPKFSLFLPEVDLKEAVQDAFKDLADRHSEFMTDQTDYLKTTLEAHFEKVSDSFGPFLQTLNNTNDMLNKASASNEQVSEKWSSTLEDFSHRHSALMASQADSIEKALKAHFEKVSTSFVPFLKTLNDASNSLKKASAANEQVSERWGKTLEDFSYRHSALMAEQADLLIKTLKDHSDDLKVALKPLLDTLNTACDALNSGADDIRKSGENFVKHISNFTRLSEPLEELKFAVDKMMDGFYARMNTLGLTMEETYQLIQKLNPDEPTYKPVFDNIKAQLDAIHATEQALLKLQQEFSDRDNTDLDEKVGTLSTGLSDVESAIERLDQTLVGNLKGVIQTLSNLPKVVGEQKQIVASVKAMEGTLSDMADALKRRDDRPPKLSFMDKLKRFF